MLRLVLGGEKSGKSDFALRRFLAGPPPHRLIVTGKALDLAFREQIGQHRLTRPAHIPVVEVGLELPEALATAKAEGVRSLLVDCLEFWLFQHLERGEVLCDSPAHAALLALLDHWGLEEEPPMVATFVSSETGLGVLAPDAAARRFVRQLGQLNQDVAARCHEIILVVAGHPLVVKG